MHQFRFRLAIVAIILAIPFAAFAAPVGKARGGGSSIDWDLDVSGHDRVEVRVSSPSGEIYTFNFKGGQTPSVRVQDLGSELEEGTYLYELRVYQKVSPDVAKKLEKARAGNDDAAAKKIMKEAGLTDLSLSGGFTVNRGSIVAPGQQESSASEPAESLRDSNNDSAPDAAATTRKPGKVQVNDQVIPDDLIVQGSGCFGFDCVNNESFGFDTIRLKENNLRIKAEDTSVGTYPTNDWQLSFNSSDSGGPSNFTVDDITGAKVPLTVTAGAATNSIFVDSTGRVGFRTSTPVLDLHVSTSNTPALRLEQTNSGGFTAQTWDVAGNEANFFVRDVTGGSRLPFRIRPGAPTSSVDISADGDVGIGTASPDAKLDVNGTTQLQPKVLLGGQEFFAAGNTSDSGVALLLGINRNTDRQLWIADSALLTQNATNGVIRLRPNNGDISAISTNATALNLSLQQNGGNVGIGCTSPTSDLVIASAGGCSTPSSSINAGATQFTAASSRTFKENIEPVEVPNILDRISKVGVYNYDFKGGPTDRIGLIAEDFHTVFERGNEKYIDGSEVQIALWMAVQKLTEQNKVLTDRLSTLEKELEEKP
jgi:hypothetical protein